MVSCLETRRGTMGNDHVNGSRCRIRGDAENQVFRIPDNISMKEAIMMRSLRVSSIQGLTETLDIQPGDFWSFSGKRSDRL